MLCGGLYFNYQERESFIEPVRHVRLNSHLQTAGCFD